jgi:hypothetical protein
VRGVERDAGLTALREQIVPAIKSLPGFQSGIWLTGNGNGNGKGLSLTLWNSEAQAQTMIDRFGVGSNPVMSASVVRCEVREVAAAA